MATGLAARIRSASVNGRVGGREADRALGEPGACRLFLRWFDETPRAEMRRQLLPEVQRALAERRAAAA
jgi:hypothetical protein